MLLYLDMPTFVFYFNSYIKTEEQVATNPDGTKLIKIGYFEKGTVR